MARARPQKTEPAAATETSAVALVLRLRAPATPRRTAEGAGYGVTHPVGLALGLGLVYFKYVIYVGPKAKRTKQRAHAPLSRVRCVACGRENKLSFSGTGLLLGCF